MPLKSNSLKYYDIYQWPAENGLNYDRDIDSAIFDELSSSEPVSSGELKRRTERTLNRRITQRTYYNHLRMLVDDGVLNRKDTGGRGKRSVFYSFSADAKRKRRLHLLRTDPEYSTVKHMYAHLFFKYLASRSGISIEDIKIQLLPAFETLLREGLIRSNNKSKFFITDRALSVLVSDICALNRIGRGKGKSPIIMGYQSQVGYQTQGEEEIDDDIIDAVNCIKKKHGTTLVRYSFLSDLIQIFCPLLFPQLPYREFMTF